MAPRFDRTTVEKSAHPPHDSDTGQENFHIYDVLLGYRMDGILLLVIVIIAAVLVFFLLIRALKWMIINAIIGLIVLFIVDYFHLMALAGRPDIGIDWVTVLICAFGGIFGAALLIILDLFGITV